MIYLLDNSIILLSKQLHINNYNYKFADIYEAEIMAARVSFDYPGFARWQHFTWITFNWRLTNQTIFLVKLRSRVTVS